MIPNQSEHPRRAPQTPAEKAHEWGQPGYEEIAQLFAERTGILFPPGRRLDAQVGIERAMQRAGIEGTAAYRRLLQNNAAAFDDLVIELTVGETYFFRHAQQLEIVRAQVLPDILRRRGTAAPIGVWSAGCASGEEAWSLAILFDQEGLLPRLELLGTDICRPALAKARAGLYGKWSFRESDSAPARPWLVPKGERLAVRASLHNRVKFRYLNLAHDVYPVGAHGSGGLDLIFCRNVLIYLDQATVRDVARRLYEALAPGGWLVTAAADPLLTGEAPFEGIMTPAGMLHRRPARVNAVQSPREWPAQAPTVAVQAAPAFPAAETTLTDHSPSEWTTQETITDLPVPDEAAAAAKHVRALGGTAPQEAERVCAAAVARHPLSAELQYLHAMLLVDLSRESEAELAANRAIYLDRSLAAAHFALGSLLERRRDLPGARRAFRNARDLCARRPAGEIVPFTESELAGTLARAADSRLATLEATKPGH